MKNRKERKERHVKRKQNKLTDIPAFKKVGFVVCLFLIIPGSICFAQAQVDSTLYSKSYLSILNLEFDQANDLVKEFPENSPLKIYIEHLSEAIPIFILENDSAYNQFKKNTDQRVDRIKKAEDSPYKLFFLSEIRLFEALLDVKFEHELWGAINFNKAHRSIVKNLESYPEFIPQYKVSGLFDIISSSVPDKYNWVKKLFGYDGTYQRGYDQVIKYSTLNDFTKAESELILKATGIFLLGIEPVSEIPYQDDHSIPKLIIYLDAFLDNKAGHANKSALKVNRLRSGVNPIESQIPQVHYLSGLNKIQEGNYDVSLKEFKSFIQFFQGKSQLKDSYFRIAQIYQFKDNPDSSAWYLNKVQQVGNTFTESDRYANSVSEQGYLSNKFINQLRLFTDGGFFEKADSLERNIDADKFSQEEVKEWNYRSARLRHKEKKYDLAIKKYLSVIENSEFNDGVYYGPNSCLQLGIIFESMAKKEEALKYYEMVFDYKRYPYQSSISGKAKNAIQRLKY